MFHRLVRCVVGLIGCACGALWSCCEQPTASSPKGAQVYQVADGTRWIVQERECTTQRLTWATLQSPKAWRVNPRLPCNQPRWWSLLRWAPQATGDESTQSTLKLGQLLNKLLWDWEPSHSGTPSETWKKRERMISLPASLCWGTNFPVACKWGHDYTEAS